MTDGYGALGVMLKLGAIIAIVVVLNAIVAAIGRSPKGERALAVTKTILAAIIITVLAVAIIGLAYAVFTTR